jgi:hypothetical protein
MARLDGRRVLAIVVLIAAASVALAEMVTVRVSAPDYATLAEHIQFKGTSINIAGKVAGESYDLELDRADLPLVYASGLEVRSLTDGYNREQERAEAEAFYCSYDSLKMFMRNWAMTFPAICKLDSMGPTYEGRWIYMVKISDNVDFDEDEPEVLLDAQHHAREWAAGQSARHFCDTLLNNYFSNPTFQNFVDNTEIWVIPIVNVDGFVYDYPGQRSYRSNRQPFNTSIGCDVNRDYNGYCAGTPASGWGALSSGSRSTHLPTDLTFMGGHGEWAYEIDAMAKFVRSRNFVANITLHSYSELVLWPFGDGVLMPDNSFAVSLGQRAAGQMSRLSGGTYTPEQTTGLYPVAGGSIDWFYGWSHWVGGLPCMGYVFELGTSFYQNLSQVDGIERECFDGAFYIFSRAESIRTTLKGEVPPPVLAPMDSSPTGDYTLHWTPVRPAYNVPDRWELEELTGLSVTEDGFESGFTRWNTNGASQSTTQKHAGTYSMSLGTGNNISNFIATKDPYPVQAGDSLVYWIWYNIENNYDVTIAEVSTNGLEWTQLHDRYTGNSSGWLRKAFSLEPWVGTSVFIRFRYMTDDGTTGSGVYIDDVRPVPAFANRTVVSANITDTLYSFTGKTPDRYYYRVRGRNATWDWNAQGPLEDIQVGATGIAAEPVRPLYTSIGVAGANPARTVGLRYAVGKSGQTSLVVYDAAGRAVRTLCSGTAEAGRYTANWDGRDNAGRTVAAGVYYCRLEADRTVTARVALVR